MQRWRIGSSQEVDRNKCLGQHARVGLAAFSWVEQVEKSAALRTVEGQVQDESVKIHTSLTSDAYELRNEDRGGHSGTFTATLIPPFCTDRVYFGLPVLLAHIPLNERDYTPSREYMKAYTHECLQAFFFHGLCYSAHICPTRKAFPICCSLSLSPKCTYPEMTPKLLHLP